MRILIGEGGADAPSSGQDGSRGAGRRSSRFGPVRHFPSHSLQGTAVKCACTGSSGLCRVFRIRSSQEDAGAGARAQRHRANPQHGSAHRRTSGAHRFAPVRPRSDRGRRAGPGSAGRLVRSSAGPTAISGQLLCAARALELHPANTSATCGSTMRDDSDGGLRDPSDERRTSQRARGVKRFVIARFTPRYLVDLASDGELVTNVPADTVDLIMGGLAGENVQDRGDDASIRGGLEVHEPGVQFRYGDGHSVASTIGIASRHP
jgi:hypothetical protein